jgi:hypothetical protein
MTARKTSTHRPIGEITRGKTARNRLRRVDIFFLLYAANLIKNNYPGVDRAFFVDLGYGFEPFTTLETAGRLRSLNPALPVLGIEIDPERVTVAEPYAGALTHFRLGGFNVPLQPGETVRAMRAFNVLRQYNEDQVAESHALMGSSLVPGGLIIEGTSDPYGRVWVANLLRKTQQLPDREPTLWMEGLLFSTNFHLGFEPGIFQPVLPKNYIHRMLPGEKIYEFMEAWKAASRQTFPVKSLGLRQWFCASAEALNASGYHIDLRQKFLRKGFLLWKFDPPPIY